MEMDKKLLDFMKNALDAKVLNVQKFGDMPENPEAPTPDAVKRTGFKCSLEGWGH
ncbi:hypothetical protein GCM10020331_069750 [Ectobacillus funiculus]